MNRRMVVYQLLTSDDGNPIHKGINILPLVDEIKVVPHELTSERESIYGRHTVSLLLSKGVIYQVRGLAIILEFMPVGTRIFINKNLCEGVGKGKMLIKIMMAFYDFYFCSFFYDEEVSYIIESIAFLIVRKVKNVYWFFYNSVFRHSEEETVGV